jgi:hypothetical protein
LATRREDVVRMVRREEGPVGRRVADKRVWWRWW